MTQPLDPRTARARPSHRTHRRLLAALALGVAAFGTLSSPQQAAADDVLVELFTSQGCNSCPPADQILGIMAKKPGVVALSFHVDYWDYLGWRDTFADPVYSLRQYAYRDSWGARVVYTPQMVVGGDLPVQGNRAGEVEDAIAVAQKTKGSGAIVIDDTSMLTARLESLPEDAVIWVARYQRAADVAIERGENAGRKISYHNVVRDLGRLGTVGSVGKMPLTLPEPGPGEGVAVWAQAGGGYGRVLAIVSYEASDGLGG